MIWMGFIGRLDVDLCRFTSWLLPFAFYLLPSHAKWDEGGAFEGAELQDNPIRRSRWAWDDLDGICWAFRCRFMPFYLLTFTFCLLPFTFLPFIFYLLHFAFYKWDEGGAFQGVELQDNPIRRPRWAWGDLDGIYWAFRCRFMPFYLFMPPFCVQLTAHSSHS